MRSLLNDACRDRVATFDPPEPTRGAPFGSPTTVPGHRHPMPRPRRSPPASGACRSPSWRCSTVTTPRIGRRWSPAILPSVRSPARTIAVSAPRLPVTNPLLAA